MSEVGFGREARPSVDGDDVDGDAVAATGPSERVDTADSRAARLARR